MKCHAQVTVTIEADAAEVGEDFIRALKKLASMWGSFGVSASVTGTAALSAMRDFQRQREEALKHAP